MQRSAHTSSSSHDPPMAPRADVEPGSGTHSVFTHFPQDPNCEICLKTKITIVSCRRRANAVVPRAENVGDLITAEHKVLSEGSESRNKSSTRCGGARFGNPVVTILPVQNKIFPRDPEELDEVPGAYKETKSDVH